MNDFWNAPKQTRGGDLTPEDASAIKQAVGQSMPEPTSTHSQGTPLASGEADWNLTCPACNGLGRRWDRTCWDCGGTGQPSTKPLSCDHDWHPIPPYGKFCMRCGDHA